MEFLRLRNTGYESDKKNSYTAGLAANKNVQQRLTYKHATRIAYYTPDGKISKFHKKYIAAKSPTDDLKSIDSFWNMVGEEDARALVMLTKDNDTERRVRKCAHYLPIGSSIKEMLGRGKISIKKIITANPYFKLTRLKFEWNGEERTIHHYLIENWLDGSKII